MSVEIMSMPLPQDSPLTSTSDSSLSDSDHGYVTPVEHFADDEQLSDNIEQTRSPVAVEHGLVVVEPELKEKIIQQVEWYFSDENLLKDSFLMKHISRNKQGYVSLKLVASLRKVKALTKEWQTVLQSIRESSVLSLNEEGTKVRRLTAAPQVDYSHVDRTILVTNYPSNEPTVQEIEQHFGKHGEVALVRILHPGRAIPLDVKPSRANHPELGKEVCILVEFESQEGAKKACKKYVSQQSWRDEIKVQLLGSKTTAMTKNKEKMTSGNQAPLESKRKRKTKNSDTPKTIISSRWQRDDSKHSTPSPRQSREGSPAKHISWRKTTPPDNHRWHHTNAKVTSERIRQHLHPDSTKEYASDSGYSRASSESPKNSPEPMKRFFSGDLTPSWRRSDKHITLRDSVIREPLGPDSSKGFRARRPPVHILIQAC